MAQSLGYLVGAVIAPIVSTALGFLLFGPFGAIIFGVGGAVVFFVTAGERDEAESPADPTLRPAERAEEGEGGE